MGKTANISWPRNAIDRADAIIRLRELVGVDSVEVEAEGLMRGAKYNVYAVKDDGTRQLIGDFKADGKGKGSVDLQLKFFDVGSRRASKWNARREPGRF